MSASALGFVSILTPLGAVEIVRYDEFVKQLFRADTFNQMIQHAMIGICEETGEVAGVIKQSLHYRKLVTKEGLEITEALIEELGDLRWYIQALMQMFDIAEQDILQYNANKLSKRYVDLRYSDKEAAERKDKKIYPIALSKDPEDPRS